MANNKDISTIMITDIVGYSKLSGDNQDLALSLLYSENIPDSKRLNEVREKIRESVKCP